MVASSPCPACWVLIATKTIAQRGGIVAVAIGRCIIRVGTQAVQVRVCRVGRRSLFSESPG
jgi:hypothetical protein